MSLVLKNVSKTFVGKVAVDNISFSIEKPGVYGLLGTNGAGKTTTIRMLLGIIKKDSGLRIIRKLDTCCQAVSQKLKYVRCYCSLASLTLAVKLCAKDYIMPDYSPMHRRCI